MDIREELKLVKQVQKGNKEAVDVLWTEINPKLYGYLLNVLHNKELAEDILQETWLKAIKSINKFKSKGVRFSAWLFAISRNLCRDHWRTQKYNTLNIDEVDILDEINSINKLDREAELEKIFLTLNKKEQDLVQLKYIAGFSYKEIATLLEVSVISARVNTHRILKKIKEQFNS